MYAIIETGGKQVRVEEGDTIDVELLHAEGDAIQFDQVLFINDGTSIQIGTPYLTGCAVQGTLLGEAKGQKVINFKYKRRKNSHRKVGHRQRYSRVKITKIALSGGK